MYDPRQSVDFDLEALLPIATIRAHTKTNDIITVTDAPLELYRESAFDAAEAYTGLWLRGDRWVNQVLPRSRKSGPRKVLLDWPSRDGIIFVTLEGVQPFTVQLRPGSRRASIDEISHQLAFSQCCNPCSKEIQDFISYRTGFSKISSFPAGIQMGMLRYITYTINNPGDIGVVWTNDRAQAGARQVLNNVVEGSGAAAEWDRYRSKV